MVRGLQEAYVLRQFLGHFQTEAAELLVELMVIRHSEHSCYDMLHLNATLDVGLLMSSVFYQCKLVEFDRWMVFQISELNNLLSSYVFHDNILTEFT